MTADKGAESLELKFEGRLADEGQVPAAVLTQVLQGLQRTIYLLAMEVEKVGVRQRDRVTRDIESKYIVMCSPPAPGSLTIAARLGDPTSGLFAQGDINNVAQKFDEVCEAITSEDRSSLVNLLPDGTRRKRTLEAFRQMIPKKGSGIRFSINNGKSVFRSVRVERGIKTLFLSGPDEETARTVTGRLVKIDFKANELTILYPPTSRELKCHYTESVEDLLLENPRELIQVTGAVIENEEGHPKEICNVEDIRELDLSPFYLTDIETPSGPLRFRKPITLEPSLDETQQLLCLEESTLGIDVCGFTRDELDEALTEELDVLWRQYAIAPDETLSPKALELKKALLEALEEVRNAEA